MSHFSVLVIGDDVEAQLAPFHEFECTGVDNEFVQNIDITEKAQAEYESTKARRCRTRDTSSFLKFVVDHYGLKLAANDQPDISGEHKYGYVLLNIDGSVRCAIKRTNPNARWDWYVVGGRWSNHLKLKDGTRCNQARRRDIDVAGMETNAAGEAGEIYDKVATVIAGREFRTWTEVRKACGDKIELARQIYRAQPVVADLDRSEDDAVRWADADSFRCSREEYVGRAARHAFSTFAVVRDRQWFERGRMGWWGVVHNERGEDEWLRHFGELVNTLPGDTLLTVVDCHI